jgi:23S rRNA-/tRNA-specific pseudouridylate synthase
MQKTYLALVQPQDPSTLASTAGRIEVPLHIDDGRVSVSSNGEGKNSITEWKVLSTSVRRSLFLSITYTYERSKPTSGISLLQLHLITGLKHQLRVHMDEVLQGTVHILLTIDRPLTSTPSTDPRRHTSHQVTQVKP